MWFQLKGYPQVFIDSVTNSKGSSRRLSKEEKPLGSVYIWSVEGVLENFGCIGNRYNIRMIFRTKHTLWKPGQKQIRNRWHSVPIVFPVNVAEATLAKQATSIHATPWT
jgi:hypothetical protein